ncbi:hypothetical protein G4B88_015113 [Cannabis sativa]|uniref:Uncharacterized protein n=1 Tax=Cannabis sativa TaxID=3483 RepID=A0A7J6F2H2_CANSA|nr:hypothetical protein G4B88_015113 [Cannabis sativa]
MRLRAKGGRAGVVVVVKDDRVVSLLATKMEARGPMECELAALIASLQVSKELALTNPGFYRSLLDKQPGSWQR